jgi:hypothetical protein
VQLSLLQFKLMFEVSIQLSGSGLTGLFGVALGVVQESGCLGHQIREGVFKLLDAQSQNIITFRLLSQGGKEAVPHQLNMARETMAQLLHNLSTGISLIWSIP